MVDPGCQYFFARLSLFTGPLRPPARTVDEAGRTGTRKLGRRDRSVSLLGLVGENLLSRTQPSATGVSRLPGSSNQLRVFRLPGLSSRSTSRCFFCSPVLSPTRSAGEGYHR